MTSTETLPSAVLVHLSDALSVPDGGFSVTLTNWTDARTGFAVSVFPELEQQLSSSVTHEDIERYISRHATTLAHPNVVLGGWRNPESGLVHLDVSVVLRSQRQAVAAAREYNQLAIWDFAHGTSVPVIGSERDQS